jgi:hypothetical protein
MRGRHALWLDGSSAAATPPSRDRFTSDREPLPAPAEPANRARTATWEMAADAVLSGEAALRAIIRDPGVSRSNHSGRFARLSSTSAPRAVYFRACGFHVYVDGSGNGSVCGSLARASLVGCASSLVSGTFCSCTRGSTASFWCAPRPRGELCAAASHEHQQRTSHSRGRSRVGVGSGAAGKHRVAGGASPCVKRRRSPTCATARRSGGSSRGLAASGACRESRARFGAHRDLHGRVYGRAVSATRMSAGCRRRPADLQLALAARGAWDARRWRIRHGPSERPRTRRPHERGVRSRPPSA